MTTTKDDWYSFISRHFQLGKKSSRGFYPLKCPVCQDTKPRAGFKFHDDGGFGYNCFRGSCRHKLRYSGGIPSENMERLFTSIGLIEADYAHLTDYLPGNDKKAFEKKLIKLEEPEEVELPLGATLLQDCDINDIRTKWAIQFLLDKGIDPLATPFYITHRPPAMGQKDFRNRIIIPFYFHEKLVFYQGRWYNPEKETNAKYLNASGGKRESIFFNMDELERQTDAPLLVVEGAFDGLVLGAVGCLSNTLTDEQIARLKRCPRRKIIVPDFDKAGHKTVEQALDENFNVSFPDWGSCGDLGDAVGKYGKFTAASMIIKGEASSKAEARIMADLYCHD